MLDAGNGALLTEQRLGDTIVEIREAELNGEPSSREFVVGGKEGGVWAFARRRRTPVGQDRGARVSTASPGLTSTTTAPRKWWSATKVAG